MEHCYHFLMVAASKEDRMQGKQARNVLPGGWSNCATPSFGSERHKSTGFSFAVLAPRD